MWHLCMDTFFLFYFLTFNFFLSFLGLHAQHMEVPRLGGQIRPTAAGLHSSHRNARSEPCLLPTPQLRAIPDPYPTEVGQGLNPKPHGS